MSEETAAFAATPAAATPKKKAKSGAVKSKANPPTHPKVSEMVVKSITTLKERGGSSLKAIQKYISSEYKVDIDSLTPFIRMYLKSAVAAGTLVQTKFKGENDSFKLSASGQKTKEPKKTVKKAAPSPKKAKAPSKKTAKPKEKAEQKKKPAAKKSTGGTKKVAKHKSPKKTKATKPKARKHKKLKTPKKAASKKASKK